MIGAKILLENRRGGDEADTEAGEPDVDAPPQHLVGKHGPRRGQSGGEHSEHDVGHHADEHRVIEREQQPLLGFGECVEVDHVADDPRDEHGEQDEVGDEEQHCEAREQRDSGTAPTVRCEHRPRTPEQGHPGGDHQQVGGPRELLVLAGDEGDVDHDSSHEQQPHLHETGRAPRRHRGAATRRPRRPATSR